MRRTTLMLLLLTSLSSSVAAVFGSSKWIRPPICPDGQTACADPILQAS